MTQKGQIIAGKYELVELAGEGGMATVWRAVMRGAAGFARTVAVKKIKPEYRAIKSYIDMFIEEARVGSELAHPNIVQVFDFCTDEATSYYLVMEWVDGIDLGRFIKSYTFSGTVTPWHLIVAASIGTLRGLGAAHERRRPDGTVAPVIHRDVSPHNILLGDNGIVKLTDFGLARARDRVFSLTAPGTVKGKLSYLSPEVARGEQATPESDIFAMGSCLWESLAGVRLFDGRSDLEVFKKIRTGQIRPLDEMRPDVPRQLAAAVHKALQLEPRDRFASAREMAYELAAILKNYTASVDAQTELGASVTEARERLAKRKLTTAQLDQPTWSFNVEVTDPRSDAAIEAPAASDSIDVEFSDASRVIAENEAEPGED